MYVYIQSHTGVYTVGFHDPSGKWHPESDHEFDEDAALRVHYLNGGCKMVENLLPRISEIERQMVVVNDALVRIEDAVPSAGRR